MLLKVIWSEFAEYQLDEIFDFYCLSAGESVARKLLVELIKESNKLLKTPLIGQKEPLLIDRKIEYRYIVFKNYKLIYSVDFDKAIVKIADVFDTRQNPPKLMRNK